MIEDLIKLAAHPINEASYVQACAEQLNQHGSLVLQGFVRPHVIADVVAASKPHEPNAFYADSTHNPWLTPPDPNLPSNHVFNRQVVSSKGLIADDQIPFESPLRAIYDDPTFRSFLCGVLGIEAIHAYADDLSSINIHFAAHGMELGWHFDNSSFAVTMLLQAPEAGGTFEYVADVRDAEAGLQAFDRVQSILDGEEPVSALCFNPGDLVLFRGRNSLHRVTPTIGATTRMLTVFAYNDEPGVTLSNSAKATFYGRT